MRKPHLRGAVLAGTAALLFCCLFAAGKAFYRFTVYHQLRAVALSFWNAYETPESGLAEQTVQKAYGGNRQGASKANLLLVQTLLQRRRFLTEFAPFPLQEQNDSVWIRCFGLWVANGQAALRVKVEKTWQYPYAPVKSAAQDTYTMLFAHSREQGWKVTRVTGLLTPEVEETLREAGVDPENSASLETYRAALETHVRAGYRKDQARRAGGSAGGNTAPPQGAYRREEACAYALRYALSPNPQYYFFDFAQGGDCTNFLSQCLSAGGGLRQQFGTPFAADGWYYRSASDRSATWTGAEAFRQYLRAPFSVLQVQPASWATVQPGDLILLLDQKGAAYHSLVITGLIEHGGQRTDLLISCHTSNRRNASLAKEFPGLEKQYIHVLGNRA